MSDFDFMGADFDVKSNAERDGGNLDEPLPKGTYQIRVTEAELEKSSSGVYTMLKIRMDVEGPKYAGRVVFERLCLAHNGSGNDTAVEIGQAKFSQLCLACGFESRPDSAGAFVGKAVDVDLVIEKSKNKEYADSNRARSFAPASAGPGAAPPAGGGGFEDDDIPF